MPYFYHQDKKIIVSTNFKVMSSSLTFFAKNNKNNFIRILDDSLSKKTNIPFLEYPLLVKNFYQRVISFYYDRFINFPVSEHYLLVRNPYRRVISFYKNKFIGLLIHQKKHSNIMWQDSQKLFFSYLNINEKTNSNNEIVEALSNVSFSDFVFNLLPNVYKSDAHLIPQHWIFYPSRIRKGKYLTRSFSSLFLKIKNRAFKDIKIIKIEDSEKMAKFASEIGFDLNIRSHSTQNIQDPDLTSDLKKIIYDIYKDDFITFGYPRD